MHWLRLYWLKALSLVTFLSIIFISCNLKLPTYTKPNVIFILVDTLRPDFLGCYGFKGDISPNIDKLASNSILFRRCISQAPWTKPSIETLFTSLYPLSYIAMFKDYERRTFRHLPEGALSTVMPEEAHTLAELFKEAGYQTAAFIGNAWLKKKWGFSQGFDVYEEPKTDELPRRGDLMEGALDWLETTSEKSPFFLYLHLMDVHGAYLCDEEDDFDVVRKSPSLGKERKLTNHERKTFPRYLARETSWKNTERAGYLANWKACYGGGVRRLDRRLGAFFQQLKNLELYNDSILILTSDHGEEFLEHGLWTHGKHLHGEMLNIPLLIKLPQGKEGGRLVKDTIGLIDVMPTLLSLARVKVDSQTLQGSDLSPLIKGKKSNRLKHVFSSYDEELRYNSVQNETYKLILDNKGEGSIALYNLTKDPMEQRNIARLESKITNDLKRKLLKQIESLRKEDKLPSHDQHLSKKDLEVLKSLGYLQ